ERLLQLRQRIGASREISSPLELMPYEVLAGVKYCSLHQLSLTTALGNSKLNSAATRTPLGEHALEHRRILGKLRHENFGRRLTAVGIRRLDHLLEQGAGRIVEFHIHDPTAFAADASTADDELVGGRRELVRAQAKHIQVDVET